MPRPDQPIVTLFGDKDDPQVREAAQLLDRSGLSYRLMENTSGGGSRDGSAYPRLACGTATLPELSRDRVVDFLRMHGAQFEDS